MKNVTLLIQGNLSQESYNYYVEKYPQYNIVVSAWSYHAVNLSYQPHNVIFVQKRIPIDGGIDYINCKLDIMLLGLDLVKTEYVIKLSGEEYFNNIEYIVSQINENPNKIHTSPLDFKHPSDKPYHISDNIIAGKTHEIKFMYSIAKEAYNTNLIYKNQKDVTTEMFLCKSYLMGKYLKEFREENLVSYLIDNFRIIDLDKLKPYKLLSNRHGLIWFNNFNPYTNKSLKSVEEVALKQNPPYIL